MEFRKDINGLRAVAVIAVVVFHFYPEYLIGGFAGVDVFFVISGFLMSKIIFHKLESKQFNLLNFYISRANRIIPPLVVLCFCLLIFGWFYLDITSYRSLGKHIASSVFFVSNIIYFKESGYFDAASLEKWLLHTWSLSVEWQFYIIYPVILIALTKVFSQRIVKLLLFSLALLSYIVGGRLAVTDPNMGYYLLPARAWEMIIGGLAFCCPIALNQRAKKIAAYFGLSLIVLSCFFSSKTMAWPGYIAIIPVFGTYLVIMSNLKDNLITNNFIIQKIGLWSYSIYLWHWPIVTYLYMSDNMKHSIYGVFISIILGYVSHRYIESYKFNSIVKFRDVIKCQPFYMLVFTSLAGGLIFYFNGVGARLDIVGGLSSPKRHCAISSYQEPSHSCEFFSDNVEWAVIGDSHTIEIAYALAEKLDKNDIGVKQFSYYACNFYNPKNEDCKKWYEDSIDYIISDSRINSVLINQRWTFGVINDNDLQKIDSLIKRLSETKDNVHIVLPFPYLSKNVGRLITKKMINGEDTSNIKVETLSEYKSNNSKVIEHFSSTTYPNNVYIIDPTDVFCDLDYCYAVRDNKILYFDDDHPSVLSMRLMVERMKI